MGISGAIHNLVYRLTQKLSETTCKMEARVSFKALGQEFTDYSSTYHNAIELAE